MTTIRLYNTKTRQKEAFVPLDPANVRMYVCGPTVYDRAHLGNARPVVVFDVLYRLLRHVYGPDHVTYVRNFTDVDDRINQTAVDRKAAGAAGSLVDLIRARSDETIRWYHDDMDAVGALRPNHEPRATEWIDAMVAMIVDLIAKGHAYTAEGHVLFAVESYAAYGALSGRSIDDMIAGARVEVAPYKRNPMDFVLWKPSGDDLPGWDSPWGRGRPGWHIECSAMAHELLGESFDIHAGGIDLQFPHHENEIAQSACAHPQGEFARVWLHNEMLQVEGKKMSKSLGNFFTVRDLLDQGVPGEVIRYVLLGTHYSGAMDWTKAKAEQAERTLMRWNGYFEAANFTNINVKGDIVIGDVPVPGLLEALSDDLNTSLALTCMLDFEKQNLANKTPNIHIVGQFLASLRLLGFSGKIRARVRFSDHRDWLNSIARGLDEVRKKQQFTYADLVKGALVKSGFEVQIGKDGTRILETSKSDLNALKNALNTLKESLE
jgi:cysteinyl-tRNA synthetase